MHLAAATSRTRSTSALLQSKIPRRCAHLWRMDAWSMFAFRAQQSRLGTGGGSESLEIKVPVKPYPKPVANAGANSDVR